VTVNTIRLDPPSVVVVSASYYTGSADIVVDTTLPVQAVDLQLSWDASALTIVDIVAHPDFDDDGQLALPVQIDAQSGVATSIVDLRHGAAAIGPVKVATVFFEAPTGAPGTLSVDGQAADPTGTLCTTSPGPAISTP